MSIRDDAYALCKTVFRVPLKEALKGLVEELNRSPRVNAPDQAVSAAQDRSLFGYLARGGRDWNRAQILPFLLLAMRSGQPLSDRFPMIIPSLRDEERELFARAHAQMLRLNYECLSPLLSRLPHYARAVSPYGHLPDVPLSEESGDDLLSTQSISAMARSFHRHPAFSIALGSNPLSAKDAEQFDLAQAVWQIDESIHRAGTIHEPKDINDIFANSRESAPNRTAFRHLSALVCLRESLTMLDQLVFQALLSENLKLPVLDEDNIIDPGRWVTTHVSKGNHVIYQRDARAPRGINDYLVLYLWPHGYKPVKELCHVEHLRIDYSGDAGMKAFIALRTIDENLNPFGQLLKSA
jgi:hypothetical protein